MKPHKHADLIKAWADGAKIQYKNTYLGRWFDNTTPIWEDHLEYRVKPREFIEGRWYPVKCDLSKRVMLYYADKANAGFLDDTFSTDFYKVEHFDWIGEPLPKIEWPEES